MDGERELTLSFLTITLNDSISLWIDISLNYLTLKKFY